MTDFYTGIGSRATPGEVLTLMTKIALALKEKGVVLRSGGAAGADTAFANGAGNVSEVYIPWNGFGEAGNKHYHGESGVVALSMISTKLKYRCYEVAGEIHPAWFAMRRDYTGKMVPVLSSAVKALHARNVLQVNGLTGDKSKFTVYWTEVDKAGNPKGGTATAVNLTKSYNIPTFNLFVWDQCLEFKKFLQDNYNINMEIRY